MVDLILMGWQSMQRLLAWLGSALLVSPVVAGGGTSGGRTLGMEVLEPRLALSAAGLIEVGSQPSGGLDGKIVYLHAGHGYTASNLGSGAWTTQRGLLLGMVEDLGNKDQMDLLADYLFRAGATIVPLRPIGHQVHEVVLDNDDHGVSFHGDWSASTSTIYFGSPGDVPYRFATTSPTETAYARYRPNLPADGFYPVYTWVQSGGNRAADQLYRVHHAGGITEVTINHRQVGNGPVYLGSYYFTAGSDGYVDISNRSSETGKVVIADMIRFGNGMGDINRGGGVSGQTREDEAGLYWVQWHVDRSQGIPSSVYRTASNDNDATVSLAPRYAAYMNREAEGSLSDRVLVSFHSNAANGTARGVMGLYNGNNNPNTATPNQFLLAQSLAKEVNDDLVAQNGQFAQNWHNRGNNVTYDRADFEFGEINNLYIGREFDATIIEVAFHDNAQDVDLMLDPKARDAIARATYQGLLKYFAQVDGGATSTTPLPSRVGDLSVQSTTEGSVTLRWSAPEVNSYAGGAPTRYLVYTSTNGYAFDGGRVATRGTQTIISGLDPNETYYFTVVAMNAAGESAYSEVVASVPKGGEQKVLIVNGFDRLDRALNPTQPYHQGGLVERVRPRQSNSFDYAIQMATAIHQSAPHLTIDTTSNERVANGAISLDAYDAVFWILGEESTADDTFDAEEQTRVTNYLSQGGKLFVSGSEIGWDLDQANNGRTFYNNILKADYVADDAGAYSAQGVSRSIFTGLSVSFDDGTLFYNVDYPDVIAPFGGSQLAMSYSSGGGAAIQWGSENGARLVMLAFPFETITTSTARQDVMSRVVDFFGLKFPPPDADFNQDGAVDAADFTIWRNHLGMAVTPGTLGDANFDGVVTTADYAIWKEQFGRLPSQPASLELAHLEMAPLEPSEAAEPQLAMEPSMEPSTPTESVSPAQPSALLAREEVDGRVANPRWAPIAPPASKRVSRSGMENAAQVAPHSPVNELSQQALLLMELEDRQHLLGNASTAHRHTGLPVEGRDGPHTPEAMPLEVTPEVGKDLPQRAMRRQV